MDSTISALIDRFLEHLTVERGSSPLTIRNYKLYLSRFSDFLSSIGTHSPSDISLDNVQKFRAQLASGDGSSPPLSRKTQGYHAIAIRSFLKWLSKIDVESLSADKIDLPKIPDRQVSAINHDEVERLLAQPQLSSLSGKRDKAILELLFSTGLRVSELTKLNRDLIDFERRELGIVGKGGRARVVFLSERSCQWVQQYLAARHDTASALFISHKSPKDITESPDKMRLTPRSVQRAVKKYAKKAKLPVNVTPHILRHSFATDLLVSGADLRSVQELLGHKNVATTQIYTHITNKRLKEVHDNFHNKKEQ
jgi:site-specific recombinase XerD